MNTIQRKWLEKEKRNARLETRKNYLVAICQAESLSGLFDTEKAIDESEQAIRERFVFLKDVFGFTESELKTLVEPDNEIFSCSEKELRIRIPYFIDLFQGEDNFKKLLNNNGYRLFKLKKVDEVAERLAALEKIFKTDRQGIIPLAISSGCYLNQPAEKILERIDKIATKQGLDYDECISLLKTYPKIYSWYAHDIADTIERWRASSTPASVSSQDVRVKVKVVAKKTADEPNTIILSGKYYSDATFAKSDWLIWTAALSEDKKKQQKLINALYRFIFDTPDRVPYSDWYDSVDATAMKYGEAKLMFRNRTV